MRMVDIIARKRDGEALSEEELRFFVDGYTRGAIPDYQASALLMAIFYRGMSREETAFLTLAMAHSGDMVDLSVIPGIKVDKHSTGGVGDKTTLIVAPIVASLGIPVAKMSGRGLGHTGGTVDKLEAIPGYRTTLSREEFLATVRSTGISVVGQSGNLAPADKKLYALRDATATVESIPLIASSIMSKKIAAGADAIVLDVKVGSGAFLKTIEEARALSLEMVRIGSQVGRKVAALVTDMDVPLGHAVGNSLEVVEAVQTLEGNGPKDLEELCVELAAGMLVLAERGTMEQCRELAGQAIRSGSAKEKLIALVEAQGGNPACLGDFNLLPRAAHIREVAAPADGVVVHMDCQRVGRASMLLGAGREKKDSPIDLAAGLELLKKTGDSVREGEPVARLHTNDPGTLDAAREELLAAVWWGTEAPPKRPAVLDRIGPDGV